MAAILRIGLLTVLTTATVTAELEYTAEMAHTLHDFEDLVSLRARRLEYKAINPGKKALLSQLQLSQNKGLHFYVHSHQLAEGLSNPEAPPSVKAVQLPAIRTALKKCLKPCELHCCSSPEDNPLQLFELREMHFTINLNRNLKPYLNLAVEFYDSSTNQAIEVSMQLFKPPITQIDKDHAKDHKVLTIKSPLPLQDGSAAPPKSGYPILVDILWMDEILGRARFDGHKDGHIATKYTELYPAGPVIIDKEAFDAILKLEPSFRKYVS